MNRIWVLVWYVGTFLASLLMMWLISMVSEIYIQYKVKQIKRKRERYRKYGMVYKYDGIFKEVINCD